MRRALLLLTAGLFAVWAVVACEGPRRTLGQAPPAPPSGQVVLVRLEGRGRAPVRVRAEVAETPRKRQQGLSGRRGVPPRTGMLFLYPADTRAEYWMKDTLVPLSIAFIGADWRVVSSAEMAPCRREECPLYGAAGPYRYALELPAGELAGAGVGRGDRVVPEDPPSLPNAS